MNTPCDHLCNWQEFDAAVAQADTPLSVFRAQLKSANDTLTAEFESGTPVQVLVTQRAALVDELLLRIWQQCLFDESADKPRDAEPKNNIALVAVGGYGRGELHPASDIDLLILTADTQTIEQYAGRIEQFLLFLWDLGLEVGHSTRSVADCTEQATADITVATNLMEARLLTGPENLFVEMKQAVGPEKSGPIWNFSGPSAKNKSPAIIVFTTRPTTSNPTSKKTPAACATCKSSAGWQNGTLAQTRYTI